MTRRGRQKLEVEFDLDDLNLEDEDIADWLTANPDVVLMAFEATPSLERDQLWDRLVEAAKRLQVRGA